jgi:hypothetical protein
MKEILFTRVKNYPKWGAKRTTLVSTFFRAFSSGPDLSLTPNCLNASSFSAPDLKTAVDLDIVWLEVFYRLRDILEANANRPVQHSFDPDSNDGLTVRQIAAYLDTTHGNGRPTLVQSLIDPGLTVFADGWVTSHLKLSFSSPIIVAYPYIRRSFAKIVYLQFIRLVASALGSSSLFNGLCSSAFQQSVDALSTCLRHVLGVVENMYLYLRSNFHQYKPESFHGMYFSFQPVSHG